MYPPLHAQKFPDKPAHVMVPSGETVTFRELDERSARLARLLWEQGLRPGDHVAVFMENHARYPEVVWAALRSGLYLTTVNRYLTAEEAAYIVDDCEARALVTSHELGEVAAEAVQQTPRLERRLMVDGALEGFEPYEEAVAAHPAEALAEEPLGEYMLYSSGTTGRPKGIRRPLSGRLAAQGNATLTPFLNGVFGIDERTVYLSPAPLYHSAPIGFTIGTQALGGTAVIMERFDPVEALRAIERHRVTHSQWVPTMFVRMLKLPEEERAGWDVSSMKVAIHAAAPCPPPVKQQMMDWWGPILHEYYGGTELNGLTYVGPEDWLARPGTVGRAILGEIHIIGEEGEELPPGEPGTVYFAKGPRFEYHNAPEKTASAYNTEGWSTLGDVGYLDEQGFLFLTDRKAYMIISGGVNIYPQEIENVLVTHPKVADVAVFGVPNDEFGEEVKAVVQPVDLDEAGPALAEELQAFAREHLAHYKCPRSIDFEVEMPRLPTGKLYKRLLRERYWSGHGSRIL